MIKCASQICPACKTPFRGPMLWPEDIFPNGPQMCCDGRECMCCGLPVDFPWFKCPSCGHRFEWSAAQIAGGTQ